MKWATVIEPFIEAGGFPDGIKVQADRIRGRNNRTRDDVVTVKE